MKELYFISVLGGLKIGSLIIIELACLIIFIIVLNISVGDDKSRQIPDKVINVIDKWLSEYEHKNDTIK